MRPFARTWAIPTPSRIIRRPIRMRVFAKFPWKSCRTWARNTVCSRGPGIVPRAGFKIAVRTMEVRANRLRLSMPRLERKAGHRYAVPCRANRRFRQHFGQVRLGCLRFSQSFEEAPLARFVTPTGNRTAEPQRHDSLCDVCAGLPGLLSHARVIRTQRDIRTLAYKVTRVTPQAEQMKTLSHGESGVCNYGNHGERWWWGRTPRLRMPGGFTEDGIEVEGGSRQGIVALKTQRARRTRNQVVSVPSAHGNIQNRCPVLKRLEDKSAKDQPYSEHTQAPLGKVVRVIFDVGIHCYAHRGHNACHQS